MDNHCPSVPACICYLSAERGLLKVLHCRRELDQLADGASWGVGGSVLGGLYPPSLLELQEAFRGHRAPEAAWNYYYYYYYFHCCFIFELDQRRIEDGNAVSNLIKRHNIQSGFLNELLEQ